jgi:trehalose-6-phosphate synthase
MVREKIPKAAIGFFLHVAFPSSEIFRCLAGKPSLSLLPSTNLLTLCNAGNIVREPLLRGLLGSDLIGFQTHNYARHFRQTVSRILAYEALPKGIQLESSFVDVAVFPIGIDVVSLTQKR